MDTRISQQASFSRERPKPSHSLRFPSHTTPKPPRHLLCFSSTLGKDPRRDPGAEIGGGLDCVPTLLATLGVYRAKTCKLRFGRPSHRSLHHRTTGRTSATEFLGACSL